MTSSRKTRNETSTLMSEYLGKGKEMLQTELPTLRDCLRYGILLKETDPAYSPTSVLAKAILIEIKQNSHVGEGLQDLLQESHLSAWHL